MSNETITSLITSLLPILITILFAWLGSRNDQSKRRQVFEDAKQRIELISAYVSSQNLVIEDPNELGDIKKTAAQELYDIKAFLNTRLQSLEKSSEKSENYFQRFFLIYKMRSRLAVFFRLLFFLALLVSFLWVFEITSTSFTPDSLEEFGLGFTIVMVIIVSAPAVLVVLLMRWLAVKFDKPAAPKRTAEALP